LITGAAGFIGMHTALRLLDRGDRVIGIDNLNNYYDVTLKEDRPKRLYAYENFSFQSLDIDDQNGVVALFSTYRPSRVIHLAAQAGVRYSIASPQAYIASNVHGFTTSSKVATTTELNT